MSSSDSFTNFETTNLRICFRETRKLMQSLVFAHAILKCVTFGEISSIDVKNVFECGVRAMLVFFYSVTVQSQLLQFFCFMLALFPILTFFSKETQFKGR